MSSPEHFSIPGQPFAWQRTKQTKSGQRFNSPELKADQARIAALGCQLFHGRQPYFGPVKLFVQAIFAIPSSMPKREQMLADAGQLYVDIDPDYDNILKEIADGLKFVAYVDDCQIADGRAVLRYGRIPSRDVWLQPLAGDGRPAVRRQKLWLAGKYNPAIAKAPCGMARWPRVIEAEAR